MNNPKFRLWDDKNKKWLLGYEYQNLGGFSMLGETMLFGEYSNAISDIDNWKNLILTQYSGLKDIDGKECYDGDILDNGDAVIFSEGCFMTPIGALCLSINHRKIVGNIFENPGKELLDMNEEISRAWKKQ